MELEEINSFQSPGEFVRFERFLADGCVRGELREIAADPAHHAGEVYGGRWFERTRDRSIWRLVPPDPPFTGMFERVT